MQYSGEFSCKRLHILLLFLGAFCPFCGKTGHFSPFWQIPHLPLCSMHKGLMRLVPMLPSHQPICGIYDISTGESKIYRVRNTIFRHSQISIVQHYHIQPREPPNPGSMERPIKCSAHYSQSTRTPILSGILKCPSRAIGPSIAPRRLLTQDGQQVDGRCTLCQLSLTQILYINIVEIAQTQINTDVATFLLYVVKK